MGAGVWCTQVQAQGKLFVEKGKVGGLWGWGSLFVAFQGSLCHL